MNSLGHATRGSRKYSKYEELYGLLWYAVTAVKQVTDHFLASQVIKLVISKYKTKFKS